MGHADVVNTLLIKGADPVSTLEHWTPLAWASYSGSLDTVRVLLRFSKEHTNIIERWGQTPLSLAASGGYLDVVKELGSLEGVAIDIPDSKGYTPLFKAATEGHPKVVAWMLRDGRSDVNHRLSSGQTMLFGAAEYGYGDIVKSLLEQKELDPNIRDKKGRSALSWAAEKAPLSIVQRLANDTRVDIQSADKDGRNAFSWSCWSKDPRVLEYFIRINPKNVDLPATRDKCTPLHYVILGHREHAEDSIRMLLATGSVDINKQDHNGRTALSLAASEGQLKLVQVLVENGADIGLMDNDGWSPVQWAAQVANTAGGGEVIQYLKSKM
jgi:ankyrin repeat protein